MLMKKKRLGLVSLLIVAMLVLASFAGCASTPAPAPVEDQPASSADEPAPAPEISNADLNIQMIAKGFQHQFWQVVKQGAQDAANDLGVGQMDFNGPGSESEINAQVDMVNAALAQNPSAIALAALDTQSVIGQLEDASSKGIPIIGFDSGVPEAPAGSIFATASTDNKAAAAIAAEKILANDTVKAAVAAATADKPVTIAILSQDATSTSITGRTVGFLDAVKAALETTHPGAVAVTGHDMYAAPSANPAEVTILVQVPPTPDASDMKNGAQAVLAEKNLVALFLSNEGAVTGLLNATNDGADLGAGKKYDGLIVAGFDAGSTQKAAVRNGLFIGSVTQDPYQIGYQAVALAVAAAKGESVSDVDTGGKWYDASNMDDADIKDLIYD